MARMTVVVNSILPCQEAFLVDAPTPNTSPHRWIQAKPESTALAFGERGIRVPTHRLVGPPLGHRVGHGVLVALAGAACRPERGRDLREVFLTLRDRLRVFSSRIGGCAVVVVWSC